MKKLLSAWIPANFYLWLTLYFVINLLQAIFTPVIQDETYYAVYGSQMAWGYFDHPPMVGLMFKLNTLFFGGVLGLRLFTVILATATVFLLRYMLPKDALNKRQNLLWFFALVFAIPVFTVYGFVSTPDILLFFFGLIYFLIFRRFINNQNFLNALLLGLAGAFLMYSKYHGGLLILLTVISSYKILFKPYIYLAGAFALLILGPHIHWLFTHDFVTLRYHFIERNTDLLTLKHPVNFILGALMLLNPVFLIGFLYKSIKYPQLNTQWARVLQYALWGTLIVFFLVSLRGQTEAHWVAICALPFFVLVFNRFVNKGLNYKSMKWGVLVFASLVFIARILLLFPLNIKTPFHKDGAAFYKQIKEAANGLPVVFGNSYPRASKYTYYTGDPAHSLNDVRSRQNQYDLLPQEKQYHNKKVFYVNKKGHMPGAHTLLLKSGEEVSYKILENLSIFSKLKAHFVNLPKHLRLNKANKVTLEIYNPYAYDLALNQNAMNLQPGIMLRHKRERFHFALGNFLTDTLKAKKVTHLTGDFLPQHIEPGSYRMYFILKPGFLHYQTVGKTEKIEIVLKN